MKRLVYPFLVALLTLGFGCSNRHNRSHRYSYKYYNNIIVNCYKLYLDDKKQRNITAIYDNNKLVKTIIFYKNLVIIDSVIYSHGELFFIEHCPPSYNKKKSNIYTIGRIVNHVLIKYWINLNRDRFDGLYAIDSIKENWEFKRFFPVDYKINNLDDFVNEIDTHIPILYDNYENFDFQFVGDKINLKIEAVSKNKFGINGILGYNPWVIDATVDSCYYAMLQLQYFEPFLLDPFSRIYLGNPYGLDSL